jgi:hypothetical protein
MTLPVIDKALLMMLVLETALLMCSRASANPAPPACDSACRERRFFQLRVQNKDKIWITACNLFRYRHCPQCVAATGQCMPNPGDMYTTDKCKESTKTQLIADPDPTQCTAMCPIPLQNDVQYHREAAEPPGIMDDKTWIPFPDPGLKVWKCTTSDGKTRAWEDEKKID